MTPVDDMRFCPYERETLPAGHDCVGDTATPGEREHHMDTAVLDHPTTAVVRTQAAAKYVSDRLRITERDLAAIREHKARLLDELASMDLIEEDLMQAADRYRRRLPSDLLLPVSEQESGELPVEAAAHAAVEGREHPYAPTQCGGA